MKILLLTKEYPPYIYGGAGIHVQYLSSELAKSISVEVRCFGDQCLQKEQLLVHGFSKAGLSFNCAEQLQSPLDAAWRGIQFSAAGIDADLLHCHTWYTYLGGIMAKQLYGIPLVITVHSLEPLRPWKREQLKGGYDYSCWIEQQALSMADAIIAVSEETKSDLLSYMKLPHERITVIHNGIDLEEYAPRGKNSSQNSSLRKYGIDTEKPYLLFVGRITRQKGILHLMRAIEQMDPHFQIVLCASAPDTPEIAAEVKNAIAKVQEHRSGVIWIRDFIEHSDMVGLYLGATVFICPSIYESFGIINLEAMACGVPVVASAVGGIKEVVVDGVTGFLIPYELSAHHSDPLLLEKFIHELAARVNQLMANPALASSMGAAGRQRAEKYFSWTTIAEKTKQLYTQVLQGSAHVH